MAELLLFPGPLPTPIQTEPPDAAERAKALDVTRSWIVEAPAGSGKTGLIIQRYLKLLADESVDDPAQVLAITFTRKATFELRDRLLAQLDGAARGTPVAGFNAATRPLAEAVLARDRERGWKLLEQPRRLNIRTIDSVCAEITGSLPVLSRSGGAASPSEDAASLYAEAARRTTSLLGGSDARLSAALSDVLLHRDGNLAECESLIAEMLAWRDQWGDLVPLAQAELDDDFLNQNVLPRLELALDHAICTALTRVANSLPPDVLHDLCELASDMGHLEGYQGDPSPLAICAGKAMPPEEKAAHVAHWTALIDLLLTRDGDFRQTRGLRTNTVRFMITGYHREQLGALIDRVRHDEELRACLCEIRNLPPGRYPPEQWAVAKSLFRVLARALVELQIVFAERGECDFAEIGLLARAALRHEGAIDAFNQASGHELQHLLVDEMQDTSSSQYELIELLTQGWDGRSQTLFLVGDPKQSIYLFRQARVERFVQTMQHKALGGLQLGILRLRANFRSQSDLVAQFNHDFTRMFPSAADPLRPERVTYQPAQAVLPATGALGRRWHAAVLPSAKDSDAIPELRRRQNRHFANEIRATVEHWLASHEQRPGSDSRAPTTAVLVRSRGHLLQVIEAFKDESRSPAIPFRAVEVEPLGQRQEVLDLVALTRALAHPADRTAWLALLRSPLCGLTLADLHLLTGSDSRSLHHTTLLELIAERGDLLSPDGIARLEPFWSTLSAALAQRGSMPLSQWVDRTFRAFNGYRFANPEARANIGQYLHLLDDLEAPGGTVEWSRLESRLGRLFAAPSVHPNAVDLMTIHGAKGLEWDVVFVPALERTGQNTYGRLLTWLELDGGSEHHDGQAAQGILAPIQSKGAEAHALNRWMHSIGSAREAAERKRLFYVACTRAKQELHLFAMPQRSAKGDLHPRAGSLLASAWEAAKDAFESVTNPVSLPIAQEEPILQQLAASDANPATAPVERTVQRIPLSHLRVTTPREAGQVRQGTTYDRPEGSFAARAFGNTVHAFLEQCAQRLAGGLTAEALLAEMPQWKTRVAAVLRASGLAPTEVARQTGGVMEALASTLSDPQGRWLLSPHPGAQSESALIAWSEQRQSLRIDRMFLGGATPLEDGSDCLWIVDYKTSTHRGTDLRSFLSEHRRQNAPQLQFYAQQMQTAGRTIRLALYYPRLAALDWWEPGTAT